MQRKIKTFSLVLFLFAPMFYSHAQDGAVITDEAVIEQWTEHAGKTVVEQRLEIGEEEIENAHAENLTNFLQRKGVQILSYGSYGLESKPSVRGFTDETVRVVIDGICVNNPQYGT
ncbi:MAG: Plug domain-containing protein, partial [Treponema sp.]|nr:Plug domain-containing protein [Treponema sp.]